MDTVTLVITEAAIICHEGRQRGSRLYMTASGLQIFKIGTVTRARKDDVYYMCAEECRKRHIPLLTLRRVWQGEGKSKTARISDPFLAGLWDTLTDEENGELRFECAMCGKYCSHTDGNGHCARCAQIWNS